jgi:hypothetical protein
MTYLKVLSLIRQNYAIYIRIDDRRILNWNPRNEEHVRRGGALLVLFPSFVWRGPEFRSLPLLCKDA